MGKQHDYIPLGTNALMRHLRMSGVKIEGSSDKKKLQNIGYYHGYKGYRFARERRNPLPLTSFDQVLSLYEFDMELKTLFYPYIMQIETSLKSCILDAICSDLATRNLPASFDVVCSACLTGAGAKEQYKELSYLASRISKQSTKRGEPVISHFTDQSRNVPIWALMETLTLGEFSEIYSCLTDRLKDDIYTHLDMPPRMRGSNVQKKDKTDLLLALLRILSSLRNSVAHNNVILDARFLIRNEPNRHVREYLGQEFKLDPVPFSQIADCMLLIVFFTSALNYAKTERKRFVSGYKRILEEYSSNKLPAEIYYKMIGKSDALKIKAALAYIAKK